MSILAAGSSREEAYRALLHDTEEGILRAYRRRVWWRSTRRRTKSRAERIFPAVLMSVGSLLLTNALWPIFSYFVFTSPLLHEPKLVSALPELPVIRQTGSVAVAQAATADTIQPRILHNDLDYTNLSNWFPQDANSINSETQETGPSTYSLSIPSLGVENANVTIGGTDLNHSLIHYPGTAHPGELGAPVIFGHSTLRQFYNPSEKNPRRYYSIFAKLMTLNPGDEIYLEYDNIRYTYSVLKKMEVKPEDTYILEQEFAGKQLKLVTCVPEGTYLRRGIVLAQLEQTTDNTVRDEVVGH